MILRLPVLLFAVLTTIVACVHLLFGNMDGSIPWMTVAAMLWIFSFFFPLDF